MKSKYLGKEFEGFVVEDVFLAKNYMASYNGKACRSHNYYKATIYNKQMNLRLTISANLLRPLLAGKRSISQVLTKNGYGCKNSEIASYKRLHGLKEE